MTIFDFHKYEGASVIDVNITDVVRMVRQVLHSKNISITFAKQIHWRKLLIFVGLINHLKLL